MADGLPPSQSGSPTKWLIPIGCLGAIIFCCGLPVSVGFIVFGAIKSSTPYQESLTRVQASPAVQALIGEPIEPAFLVMGNVEVSGPNGHAGLNYSVSGPDGKATVILEAEKVGGEWTFNVLKVQPAGSGEEIDLLDTQEEESSDEVIPETAPGDEGEANE